MDETKSVRFIKLLGKLLQKLVLPIVILVVGGILLYHYEGCKEQNYKYSIIYNSVDCITDHTAVGIYSLDGTLLDGCKLSADKPLVTLDEEFQKETFYLRFSDTTKLKLDDFKVSKRGIELKINCIKTTHSSKPSSEKRPENAVASAKNNQTLPDENKPIDKSNGETVVLKEEQEVITSGLISAKAFPDLRLDALKIRFLGKEGKVEYSGAFSIETKQFEFDTKFEVIYENETIYSKLKTSGDVFSISLDSSNVDNLFD